MPPPATRVNALQLEVLRRTREGEFIPCVSHPQPELWTSNDIGELEFAAGLCWEWCPIRAMCRHAGEFATHGVWGGIIQEYPLTDEEIDADA